MCAYYMRVSLYEIERMKTASVYDHRRSLARRRKVTTHNSFAFETREKFFKISAEKPQAKQRATREKIKSSRVHTYQHLDLRDVNRAHYVSFPVLFVSSKCCCCSLLFSVRSFSLSFSLLLIRLRFGFLFCFFAVKVVAASALRCELRS